MKLGQLQQSAETSRSFEERNRSETGPVVVIGRGYTERPDRHSVLVRAPHGMIRRKVGRDEVRE